MRNLFFVTYIAFVAVAVSVPLSSKAQNYFSEVKTCGNNQYTVSIIDAQEAGTYIMNYQVNSGNEKQKTISFSYEARTGKPEEFSSTCNQNGNYAIAIIDSYTGDSIVDSINYRPSVSVYIISSASDIVFPSQFELFTLRASTRSVTSSKTHSVYIDAQGSVFYVVFAGRSEMRHAVISPSQEYLYEAVVYEDDLISLEKCQSIHGFTASSKFPNLVLDIEIGQAPVALFPDNPSYPEGYGCRGGTELSTSSYNVVVSSGKLAASAISPNDSEPDIIDSHDEEAFKDSEPDTTEPDTTEPDTTEPDTTEPDTYDETQSDSYPEEVSISNTALRSQLRGKIILRAQANGEAYYIHPIASKMIYLSRPSGAFSIMREQGIGITNSDLEKIPVGLSGISGDDSDGDGLSDAFEDALGTDPKQQDSDNDSYSDFEEIQNGYSPLEALGRPVERDSYFAEEHAGKIFLQVQANGEAWYINPVDHKRYFMGRPLDAFQIMRALGLGISETNFESL